MIALLSLLLLVGEDPLPATDPIFQADYAAVRAVGGYEMYLPDRSCFRKMETEERARSSAPGTNAAAASFMQRDLSARG